MRLAFLCVFVTTVAGCASQTAAQRTAPLSEPEIYGLMRAGHQAQLAVLEIAQEQATSPGLRGYAGMLQGQQRAALDRLDLLAARRGIRPADTPLSRQLLADAMTQREGLKSAAPDVFDRTFLQAQAALHARVLDLLETRMLPAAKDPQLVSELLGTRAVLQSQLDLMRARQTAHKTRNPWGASPGVSSLTN